MTTQYFFVIGTLADGQFHFSKIKHSILSTVPGVIRSRVFRMPSGYPVLVSGGLTPVRGDLYEVALSETMGAFLDQMHGFSAIDPEKSVSSKELTAVELPNGEVVLASVYFVKESALPKKATEIMDGQWQVALQTHPPLFERLTERQRIFIKKLSLLTGREGLPIDLPLYRELMNLELIIDKGRRLALTSLGKEVAQYLG